MIFPVAIDHSAVSECVRAQPAREPRHELEECEQWSGTSAISSWTPTGPLQALPKMVRFQYMVILAYMWSAVFSIYIGTIALLGPSIAAHTILLIGVFFTADVFRRARARSLSDDELFQDPVDRTAM